MIDLNRIRSLKTLEEMKKDLNEFINNPEVKNIYIEEYNWGEEDYEDDRDHALYTLEKVERRIQSLDKYLKSQSGKKNMVRKQKSEEDSVTSD